MNAALFCGTEILDTEDRVNAELRTGDWDRPNAGLRAEGNAV